MTPLPAPVVFLPGLLGTQLRDEYPVEPRTVYSARSNVPLLENLSGDFERISLHPDDLRYERVEPARVMADSVLTLMYREFIMELRHSLSKDPAAPVPVFPFAYDWRQPLEQIEDGLARFIAEVIDRTRLIRHFAESEWLRAPRVNLVGHSMGGLVIAGLLARRPVIAQQIGRVATIGTPYRGSMEAVTKLCMGVSTLGVDSSSARERETARMTPALYYLLPDYAGASAPELDWFRHSSWQAGVLATIKRHLDQYSIKLRGKATDADAEALLAAMLAKARAHREMISQPSVPGGLSPSDWLAIVGVGEPTRRRIKVSRRGGERPVYAFEAAEKDAGDGTVALEGALPSFLKPANLVAVSASDFGIGEIADRLLKSGIGLHALLPSVNVVQRLVVSLFQDLREGPPGGHPMAGVARAQWRPPHALDAKARSTRWRTVDPS